MSVSSFDKEEVETQTEQQKRPIGHNTVAGFATMDIDDLRAFVETAEAGGMTAAARRLSISKSVVSRRIARLENHLSAKLVSRTTRGLSLTDSGAAFKVHADKILAELDAGRNAIRADSATLDGSLRISASLSFGIARLAPALADFALRHPALRIYVRYTDRAVDLVGERFDAAIRLGVLPDRATDRANGVDDGG